MLKIKLLQKWLVRFLFVLKGSKKYTAYSFKMKLNEILFTLGSFL